MTDNNSMKVLKIPSLKKGGENYQSWKRLFRAYARKLKFLECLNEGVDTTSEQQAACYDDKFVLTLTMTSRRVPLTMSFSLKN